GGLLGPARQKSYFNHATGPQKGGTRNGRCLRGDLLEQLVSAIKEGHSGEYHERDFGAALSSIHFRDEVRRSDVQGHSCGEWECVCRDRPRIHCELLN